MRREACLGCCLERVACCGSRVARGVLHVACRTWRVARCVSHVACGMLQDGLRRAVRETDEGRCIAGTSSFLVLHEEAFAF